MAALAVAVSSVARAQTDPVPATVLDPARLVSQLGAEAWDGSDGLPQSRVEAIAQSSDGHLWVGTQEGLARFDGVTFATIGRGTGGLPNTDIRSLAPAPEGGVWVGTRRGGLALVDARLGVRLYGEEAGLPSPAVMALAPEPDGGLWVGTREGLCHLPPGAATATCLDGLPDPYVGALYRDPDGTLWVGTRGGLAVVQRGRARSLAGAGPLAAEPVNALAPDGEGGVWVGTPAGLGLLRGGRLIDRPEAAAVGAQEVDALLVDGAGSLWVGTVGAGLLRLRGARSETLATADGADLSTVIALAEDREGGLWIGTGGSGLARLRTTKFLPITAREGLPSDRAYTIAASPDGGIWAGTTAGLARVVDGRVTQALTAADGLLGDDVGTVYATRDGTVWAAILGEGVCRVRGGAVAGCLTPGAGVPDPFATAFVQGADGTLWLGTDAGLSRWDGTSFRPVDADGARGVPVTALAEGPDGVLWAGTYGAGLLRYTAGEARAVAGTETDNILTVHVRSNGDVWAGTDGSGVLLLRGGARPVHRLTAADGLPSDIIPQILEDGSGRLWMTSNRGVFTAPALAFEAAARGRTRLAPTLYTRADGLPRTEANGGSQPAGARAADGSLYFPTSGGIAAITPGRIPTNPRAPLVAIQRMTVDGEPVSLGQGAVSVPPGRREFSFAYAGLSFGQPGSVRHRFRLDGRDTRWTEAGGRREAFYTDLAPGDYTFRVQAANADGVWSESDATVTFTLRPHFWQTGWFAALCVVLAVGAAFGAYKGRTAQLRARQRQLEATVAERTAELAAEKAETERLNAELSVFNATLQDKVREQLEQIVRGSRLQKYFPRKIVDRILNQEGDVEVAAERRRITVVFTDLAGFTRLSETTPPDRVTALLNEYLNEMVALIDAHGGTLDKVMGDGIMVLFGAADDMPPDRQARQALAMGAEMQRAMGRLAERWRREGVEQPVALRVGIHQADVTVGNFGTDELVEFTAIGRGVNLAARLEGACPPGGVMASEEVVLQAGPGAVVGAPVDLTLKGIEAPVRAYSLAPAGVPEGG